MIEQKENNRAQNALCPLQTEGRAREIEVETQILAAKRLSDSEFWRRVRLGDRNHPDFVQEETLVYLLRERFRNGEAHAAGDLAEILVERSAGFINRQVAAWKSLTPAHAEDCIADVYSQMWLDLFNLARNSEFWEVRFWLCLKRRILNTVQKYRPVDEFEYQPSPLQDSDGAQTDAMDRMPAAERLTSHNLVEIREALDLLPDRERTVFVLYHYEDWTQQEIASRLNITDRTVRNALERAEKRLQGWRAGF